MIAQWIAAGESGSVVGLLGCGRANLLSFLCQHPEAVQRFLPDHVTPPILISADIYNLPANDLSSLYRTILHAFYWFRERFDEVTAEQIEALYLENRAEQDPFLSQKALYDLMRRFQTQGLRIVLVLNRFDRFCEMATPQMVNTLQGLRDNFKETLSYIVGMVYQVADFPDPAILGGMYELLDSHVCWVGALAEDDARYMLERILSTAPVAPTSAEKEAMLALSGRFPVLLKSIGQWWLMTQNRPANLDDWCEHLLMEESVLHRLERIWNGLTQEEKLLLFEVQKREVAPLVARPAEQQRLMARLEAKGVFRCTKNGWHVNGDLLAAYIARMKGRVGGRIWLDDGERIIYQGREPVEELTGLQYEILRFLIQNPRVRHTRDEIIDNAWPEEEQREGIAPNALQAHVASIRKKIEPNPATPRYLLTWYGRPGGYQFFPEGKPE